MDLLQVGESIAVASFASSATADLVLTEIAGDTECDAAKSAIDGWTASGSTGESLPLRAISRMVR